MRTGQVHRQGKPHAAIDCREKHDRLPSEMLRSLAVLMLTLQFRPMVVAAICLAGDDSAVEHCAMMAMPPGQTKNHNTAPTTPTNCPAAQLCSTNSTVLPVCFMPATPQAVAHDTIAPQLLPRLHVAEPTAPPVPPPNT